jgi:acyl-CoA reductase-like NAD-dependent aldehyde dehydrogenase
VTAGSSRTIVVDDPATEAVIGEVPAGDADDVDRAVQPAATAFANDGTWARPQSSGPCSGRTAAG